ncbi:MAG: phosphoethanolamine transferase CptA [Proteobacteria bacterium]|nr:phosphoethanolamine transferase CptA [Pseudomonadota bacterium]
MNGSLEIEPACPWRGYRAKRHQKHLQNMLEKMQQRPFLLEIQKIVSL